MEALEAGKTERTDEVMRHFLMVAAEAMVQVARRFLTDQPRNEYENIAFTAVRLIAFTFGRKVPHVVPG